MVLFSVKVANICRGVVLFTVKVATICRGVVLFNVKVANIVIINWINTLRNVY